MFLSPKSKFYPNVVEALKAKETLQMIKQQPFPFEDREIIQVFNAISQEEYEIYRYIEAYNFGYIMGVRAERERRKAAKRRAK